MVSLSRTVSVPWRNTRIGTMRKLRSSGSTRPGLAHVTEARSDYEELGRFLAAGGGLDVAPLRKTSFQAVKQVLLAAALPALRDETATGRQHLLREIQCPLGQAHHPQMVGRG